jgi:hypothetical protein
MPGPVALYEIKALWNGFTGSPGYSTFFFDSSIAGSASAHHVQAFFETQKNALPGVVTIQVQNSGFLVDAASGHQVGVWNESTITPTTGTDHNGFNGTAGYTVNWRTDALSPKGRQIQGRTFMVPASASCFDVTTGRLSDAFHTVIQGAADALISAVPGALCVYTRPTTKTSNDGVAHPVSLARVAREGQFLTSRRQ